MKNYYRIILIKQINNTIQYIFIMDSKNKSPKKNQPIKVCKTKLKKKIKIVKKNKSLENKKSNDPTIDYINSMDEKEKLAYEIAKDHLESSFSISRCIGFKRYITSN